jgi:ribosomal protein S18 acetylase RimI-like enzyme
MAGASGVRVSLTYRDATAADAAALDRLFDEVFCGTFGHLYAPEDLESFLTSYGVSDWERDLADARFAVRVAESDVGIAGYLKLGPMKLPIETSGPALLIDQLYVRPEHHGAGVAAALMDSAFVEARRRGAEELYLTVFVDNHRARRFYERFGFETVGKYDFMVGSQADDDLIMRKTL